MTKQFIITGLSALYDLGFSSFKPQYIHIELPQGTNTTNYSNKYKISIQSSNTLNIGLIEKNGKLYYCPERLFIEFDKFKIENTIKENIYKKLIKDINPQKVNDIFKKIKRKRRGIDRTRIIEYLSKNLMLIEELLTNTDNKSRIIREYIMALMSKKDFPLTLIKGGSAIELFVPFKRATEDIDSHTDINNIHQIKEYLQNKELLIYFDIETIKDNNKIIQLELKAKSRKKNVQKLLVEINSLKLTLNTSYSIEEIKTIIYDFNVKKIFLKSINNAKALIFTQEMLLAEKYHSLITKTTTTKRTKDLIDLANIYNEQIDFEKFYKWLFLKWTRTKNPLNKIDAIKFIDEHKDDELTKIKNNYIDASDMYENNIPFNDAMKVYKEISYKILKNN